MDTLRVLVSSDIHGGQRDEHDVNLLPRLSAAITANRPMTGCLVLDNGDSFFGGPLVDFLATVPDERHAVAAWYRACGYDAMNVGNEDLRLGRRRLEALARRHALPLVSCSIPESAEILPVRVLSVRLGSGRVLKIAVVGSLPATACDDPSVAHSQLDAIRRALSPQRHEYDVAIVLCHAGLDGGRGFPEEEFVARKVADETGVPLVVAGHLHETRVDARADGSVVIAPGSHARYLGVVDFAVEVQTKSLVRLVCTSAENVAVDRFREDSTARRRVVPVTEAVDHWLSETLAVREDELGSEGAPFTRPTSSAWMESAIRRSSPGVRAEDVVLTQCAGGMGPLPWLTVGPGPIRRSDVLKLYPYKNSLVQAEVTGETLRTWLEASNAKFAPIKRGSARQSVIDESVPLCDFDFYSHVSCRLLLHEPAGRRVRSATVNGEPLQTSRRYRVVLNDYRLRRLSRYAKPVTTAVIAPSVDELLLQAVDAPVPPPTGRTVLAYDAQCVLFYRTREVRNGRFEPAVRTMALSPSFSLDVPEPGGVAL